MKVITEGHVYHLENFEDKTAHTVLNFIHKEPVRDPPDGEMFTVQDGTTNEEVLSVLIDRMKYLQDKFPCTENAVVIFKLQESLWWLEKRTKDREKRGVEGKHIA